MKLYENNYFAILIFIVVAIVLVSSLQQSAPNDQGISGVAQWMLCPRTANCKKVNSSDPRCTIAKTGLCESYSKVVK